MLDICITNEDGKRLYRDDIYLRNSSKVSALQVRKGKRVVRRFTDYNLILPCLHIGNFCSSKVAYSRFWNNLCDCFPFSQSGTVAMYPAHTSVHARWFKMHTLSVFCFSSVVKIRFLDGKGVWLFLTLALFTTLMAVLKMEFQSVVLLTVDVCRIAECNRVNDYDGVKKKDRNFGSGAKLSSLSKSSRMMSRSPSKRAMSLKVCHPPILVPLSTASVQQAFDNIPAVTPAPCSAERLTPIRPGL